MNVQGPDWAHGQEAPHEVIVVSVRFSFNFPLSVR